jgi:hypothetical protein
VSVAGAVGPLGGAPVARLRRCSSRRPSSWPCVAAARVPRRASGRRRGGRLGRAAQAATFELLLSTGVLVVAVCSAAGADRRADGLARDPVGPPGRRVWGILAVLPLVIPSYVAALALLAALGRAAPCSRRSPDRSGVERLPDVTGLPAPCWR